MTIAAHRREDMQAAEVSRRTLTRLKWVTTIVPAVTVFLYETVRHGLLEHLLPTTYGNLIIGVVTFALAYGFSTVVFGIVERLQTHALARSREIAALNAMIQEREHLSRELHDGLAQLVAYLLLRIDTVRDLVQDDRRPEAVAELDRLRAAADDLYVDIRESITGLRTRVSEQGLYGALQEYLDTFEEWHGVSIDLRIEDLPAGISPLIGFQLLRIAQEALANARKHARAAHVCVTLTFPQLGLLQMIIADDGQGFDPAVAAQSGHRSFGMATMRERAACLGGTVCIESQPGAGARVIVAVPLHDMKGPETDAALADAAR